MSHRVFRSSRDIIVSLTLINDIQSNVLMIRPENIVDKDQVMSTSVGDIKKSINHISNQLAFIGAQTRKTDQQLNFLGERLTIVTGEVSELGDADLTKLVTDLQATIVNRDAAQAAFVKIGQQSLFDFLR